ncbi:MAG TPA: VOC family protein [Nocardioidaceae bacterium]|jgi:predicted enzyme related to lactoylglutathione lyase|nr:VOC family protein [Nocardioidaceae bacterium]
MSNRIVHFEIPYEDQKRATGFYKDAFGWDISPMPEMEYTIVSTGPSGEQGPTEPGYINGGMFQREAPFGSPVLTVSVDDIDAALEKISTLGGTTELAKQPVGDMGFAAYFKDTEGNLMGLWQNA